jgi:ISXO2-like transposase domain
MHGTRLPLRTWFWAAYLVSTFHPGISAKQLQRQLGIGCHETAWAMLHKLRGAMVAPERELLKREVEIDEFFLGGYEEGLKGGRQRGKKTLCGVAIEVRGRGSGRLRLAVLADASGPTLTTFTKDTTAPGAIVHTDGARRLLLRLASNCCPARTARSATSRHGCTARTAVSHPSTCRSIWTSSSSATTAAARRWPASKRCSGSDSRTSRSPTATSSTEPLDSYLERTRYALAV